MRGNQELVLGLCFKMMLIELEPPQAKWLTGLYLLSWRIIIKKELNQSKKELKYPSHLFLLNALRKLKIYVKLK
jgi:hypothetical protein